MKNKYILFFLATSFFLFLGMNTASAADMNYSVKAIIPENQIDKNKTYFDLKMEPSQEQAIILEFENYGDQEVTIQVQTNRATTNRNGVINYGISNQKIDSSLQYDIEKIISGEKEVSLNAKEKKQVNYKIKMPEKEINGILLGGFYIHKKLTQEEEKIEENVQIKNDFSYVIGIKLQENSKKIDPELKLNQIVPGLQNYRTVVNATLQNTKPVIISEMKVDARISKKGTSEVLHQTIKENQTMAPNSNYEFPISWGNQKLSPGKYNLVLTAEDKEGHQWKFSKEFEIKNDVKKLNQEAVELEKDDYTLLYIGTVIILVIIIGVLLYLNKKRKDKTNK